MAGKNEPTKPPANPPGVKPPETNAGPVGEKPNVDPVVGDPAKLEPGETLPGASGGMPKLGSEPPNPGPANPTAPGFPGVGDSGSFRERAGLGASDDPLGLSPEPANPLFPSRRQTEFLPPSGGKLPSHVLAGIGPNGDVDGDGVVTIRDAAAIIRQFVAAMRAGRIWEAVTLAGKLLSVAGELGFLQAFDRLAMVAPDEHEAMRADFDAAVREMEAARGDVVGNAARLVQGFTVNPDSGAPAPLAAQATGARGTLKTFAANDVLSMWELLTSAVVLIRRLIA